MTDPTPRPDDELVSAVLDGEATADERAQVEADPEARQRLAELRAVRDLLGAPVVVPATAREAAIAAALAEFDATTARPGAPASDREAHVPPPADGDAQARDDLAARRARRGSGSGGRFLAVAAAIVVVIIGAGVIVRLLNPPSELTAATSAGQSAEVTQPDAAAGGSGESPVSENLDAGPITSTTAPTDLSGPTTTTPSLPLLPEIGAQAYTAVVTVDLGDIATTRELWDRMLGVVDARTTDAASGAPAPTTAVSGADTGPSLNEFVSCASYLDAVDPELDQLLAVGGATFQGQVATVYAFHIDPIAHPAANGSVRIYAVDPTTCATVSVLTVR